LQTDNNIPLDTYSNSHGHGWHIWYGRYSSWVIEGTIRHWGPGPRMCLGWHKTLCIRVEFELLTTTKGKLWEMTIILKINKLYLPQNKRSAVVGAISNFIRSILHFLTLAYGFRVDFSEDREPTEELGDRPGPEVDVQLPSLPRAITDFVSPTDTISSGVFNKIWLEGAQEAPLEDNPPSSEPSFLNSSDDCKSARKIANIREI